LTITPWIENEKTPSQQQCKYINELIFAFPSSLPYLIPGNYLDMLLNGVP
jgi:hypothetical protein